MARGDPARAAQVKDRPRGLPVFMPCAANREQERPMAEHPQQPNHHTMPAVGKTSDMAGMSARRDASGPAGLSSPSSGGVPLPPGDVCTPAVLHPAPSVRRPPRAPATILCRRRHRIVAMTCAGSVPSASRIWWGPRRDRSPSRAPPLPYGRVVRGNQSTASIACLRSAMMSSAFSMPQLRRTRSMPTPASMSCSSVS